ncbi:hypothetical protein [Sutterella wadsworthensis]|uniref:hypothetical protein n=1 Tax=Sutterella wadsworthensis TaxID=40545 RepID=UPI003AF046D0
MTPRKTSLRPIARGRGAERIVVVQGEIHRLGEEDTPIVLLQLQWKPNKYGAKTAHSAYLSAENVDELIDLLVKAKNRVPVWSDEDED